MHIVEDRGIRLMRHGLFFFGTAVHDQTTAMAGLDSTVDETGTPISPPKFDWSTSSAGVAGNVGNGSITFDNRCEAEPSLRFIRGRLPPVAPVGDEPGTGYPEPLLVPLMAVDNEAVEVVDTLPCAFVPTPGLGVVEKKMP